MKKSTGIIEEFFHELAVELFNAYLTARHFKDLKFKIYPEEIENFPVYPKSIIDNDRRTNSVSIEVSPGIEYPLLTYGINLSKEEMIQIAISIRNALKNVRYDMTDECFMPPLFEFEPEPDYCSVLENIPTIVKLKEFLHNNKTLESSLDRLLSYIDLPGFTVPKKTEWICDKLYALKPKKHILIEGCIAEYFKRIEEGISPVEEVKEEEVKTPAPSFGALIAEQKKEESMVRKIV